MDNRTRIENAAATIRYFESLTDSDESLIDLLTDLRHWAEENELDFESALLMSEIHFNQE